MLGGCDYEGNYHYESISDGEDRKCEVISEYAKTYSQLRPSWYGSDILTTRNIILQCWWINWYRFSEENNLNVKWDIKYIPRVKRIKVKNN